MLVMIWIILILFSGNSYAANLEISTAGTNLGIGTTSQSNALSIASTLAVGSSYTSTAAPANGAIIQGNVGIGSTNPGVVLDVNGTVRATSFMLSTPGVIFTAPIQTLPFAFSSATSDTVSGTNVVYAAYFYLPFNITVNHIGAIVTTAAGASNMNLGIYSSDRLTKIIDSGAIATTGTGYKTASVAGVILQQGFYWVAYSFTSTSIVLRGWFNQGDSGLSSGNANIWGSAANATSSNILPSALGAITASGNNGALVILTNY